MIDKRYRRQKKKMGFERLPSDLRILLDEIVSAENAVSLLCDKLEKASSQQAQELKSMLLELTEGGYIKIQWADNKPYYIRINNSARTYEEQLSEYESKNQTPGTQSIVIGNNNKIKNSTIAGIIDMNGANEKKGFYEKHPVLCSFLISLVAGIVLLFPFWNQIVSFIEGLF